MNAYYIEYPRDFANEYTVFAVESADVPEFVAAFPEARKITRAKAIERGWARPREARKYGEQWYGSFAGLCADTLQDAIKSANEATRQALAMVEVG